MTVIDHTDNTWSALQRRPNGAEKYSRDIIQVDVPVWRELYRQSNGLLISTCPTFNKVEAVQYPGDWSTAFAVQYLHVFPHKDPAGYAHLVLNQSPFKTTKTVFISAYASYVNILRASGIDAYYMPMYINTDAAPAHDGSAGEKDIIWFGNVYTTKRGNFQKAKEVAAEMGLRLHYISEGVYHRPDGGQMPVTQEQAWQQVARFKYGIGVGRCALEMMAIGLRVLILGDNVGGIVTTRAEYDAQQRVNFNGRVCTYDNNIGNCLTAMITLPEEGYAIIRPLPDMEERRAIINKIICDLS